MIPREIPIFIATPFIGQGDITNIEWIDGRIELFEAVTVNSILHLLRNKNIHWLIFLGENPVEKVKNYAEENFSNIENIHLMKSRFGVENINNLAIDLSENDHYITTLIADDDAWNRDYIQMVDEQVELLFSQEDFHAGVSFSNGLEWLMADQVDLHFIEKSDFYILRKENLVEYHYPWLGCGFFVLQTKERPFRQLTAAHPTIPKKLAEENFSVHIANNPKRVWLYNRHQLSASSLCKSENPSIDLDLEQLEYEFGISAEKIRNWKNTPYSKLYTEKTQGVGILKTYTFPDLEDFVNIKNKVRYFCDDFLEIDLDEYNINDTCRVRIYDETEKMYLSLHVINHSTHRKLILHESFFNRNSKYKFDIQTKKEGNWSRIMPYQLVRFDRMEDGKNISPKFVYIDLDSLSVDHNNHLRIHIKSPESHQIHELKNHSCSLLGIDSNYIKNNKKTTFVVESKDGDIWKQISSGKIVELIHN